MVVDVETSSLVCILGVVCTDLLTTSAVIEGPIVLRSSDKMNKVRHYIPHMTHEKMGWDHARATNVQALQLPPKQESPWSRMDAATCTYFYDGFIA